MALIFFLSFSLCAENKRIVHFSIDDTITVFQHLTKSESKYKTAFEEPLLKRLRKLHKEFGLKVTLYVFYSYNGFSLEDCTSHFAEDFQKNRDWLKFAYHSYNENEVFKNDFENTCKLSIGYDKAIEQLLRITGSADCISDTARLHYFKGGKEYVSKIKALLTADSDSRHSYFLTEVQEKELLQKEKIFDEDTGIRFYKTDFRLDNPKYFKSLFSQNKDESEIVFFTHEWLLQLRPRKNVFAWVSGIFLRRKIFSNLKKICEYAKEANLNFVNDLGDFYE